MNIKNYIGTVLGITFISSILNAIRFIIIKTKPPLEKMFLIGHTTFFLFICVAVSVIILSLLHTLTTRFFKIKIGVKGYIVLFWILTAIHFVLAISPKVAKIGPKIFSIPWIPVLYILALILVLFICRWIKNKEAPIMSSASAFIALVISVCLYNWLDARFISPLTKENILLAAVILTGLGLLGVLCYWFFYKISFKLYHVYDEESYLKVLIILYICISMGISIFGFFQENKKADFVLRDIPSNTKQDINIILIAIDALRADHLGCYGYERDTSPYIDAFAREGVLFKNCYVQASWTPQSTGSLFTSLYPTMHGATHEDALPDEVTTLAELLHKEGFITYGYVANPTLRVKFNFNQGFDFFDDYLMSDKLYCVSLRSMVPFNVILKKVSGRTFNYRDRDNIRLANKRIIPWLEKYIDKNFFMYIHYMDPHWAYAPPKPYRGMYPYIRGDKNSEYMSMYDGEIRFADEYIGKLFDKLKSWGIYDKTLIIITADHGEAFGDHGDIGHGRTIYDELLKTPLIIKYPGSIPRGKTVDARVRNIDIMPTILDFLNISYAGHLEGASLLPLLKDEQEKLFEDIFIEENAINRFILKGVIKDEWKYIYTIRSELRDVKKDGHEELYNLIDDPGELNNLVEQEAEVLKIMRDRLKFYKKYCQERAIAPSKKELDYDTIQQLKALGYLH